MLLLFSHLLLHGQTTQRNLLANKYTAADIRKAVIAKSDWKPYPTTAAEWRAALPDTVVKSLLVNGEAALHYNFEPISATISMDFQRSGDRQRHGKISFGKRNALVELILAESVEDKGQFMETIFNGIWSICEESYWGVPAHISNTGLPDVDNPIVDLFSAETAAVMALADYFVGEKLDKINPLIRKRMYSETNKRFFIPMMDHRDKYKWMNKTKPVNNWNPWIMSNWIWSTLLLEKDENRRADMLYAAMTGLDLYLNSLGDEGGCDEGPSYWFAAGGSVYDCLELLQKATKGEINIYKEPLIQKMASYIYKTHIDGVYFTNFADADPTLQPDGLMLYRFGKAIKDEQMVQFGQWMYQHFPNTDVTGFQRMRRLENILLAKNIEQNNTYEPVKDTWISDIQFMAARTPEGLYLAAHGGHNAESHNHNDVGDFILYANGQPMIVDAGRGNYTARTFSNKRYELWFTQSEYHNLPIVNGIAQKAGREFEAQNVLCTRTDKEARLELDIAAAYPKEAGIQIWKRTISLHRATNQVKLMDAYNLAAKPTDLKQIFMTICDVNTSKQGKIALKGAKDTEIELNYDAALWTVSTEQPSTEGMEYASFKNKWTGRKITRIILTHKNAPQQGKYTFTFDKK